MKNELTRKIKSLLSNFNSINNQAVIHSSAKIVGSTLDSSVKVDEKTQVYNSILNGLSIEVGSFNFVKNSVINGSFSSDKNCKIVGCNLEGNIRIGKYTSLWGPNLDIVSGKQSVEIGNFCSIARNVTFQTFNHNHKKLTTYFIGQNLFNEKWENERISKGNIVIENDVWIGAHSVILGGVTISNGAVVAANSVVTKNVPPYSIIAGTPAKVIGYRFDEITIQNLLKMNWWDWSVEKIKENKHLFENEWNSI